MRGSRAYLRGSIHPRLIVFGVIAVLLLSSLPVRAAGPDLVTCRP